MRPPSARRYVVTEFGVARLFGRSIRERVLAMIDIAHPSHREAFFQWRKSTVTPIRTGIYACSAACKYPPEIETLKTFGHGLELKIRPILPSDEDMMRRLFYHFRTSQSTCAFLPLSIMPHKMLNTSTSTATRLSQ